MDNTHEIEILPDHIANQIAAGEVVERPESIVKELVENSLDAGATSIAVHVRAAGKDMIMVRDDGRGMRGGDLERAVLRHATSKLRESADLHNIRTLGFRGEALAAIAAVADLEIRSRRAEESHGRRLVMRPSSAPEIKPDAVSVGTQVTVRNLFYNVPARRKFLRTNLTEFKHIHDTMLKFALGNPDVQFSLHDDDRAIMTLEASTEAERVATLLGADSAESMIPIAYNSDLLRIHGFVGPPSLARKSRADQHFFLNRRIIVSRQLSHAVLTAFEHILDKQQFPVFVLYLTVDPQRVDVNVHPRKQEVKFDQDRLVYNAVLDAVAAGLRTRDIVPTMDAGPLPPDVRAPFERVGFSDRPGAALVNRVTGELYEPSRRFNDGERGGVTNWSGGTGGFSGGSAFSGAREFGGFDERRPTAGDRGLFGGEAPQERRTDALAFGGESAAPFVFQLHRRFIVSAAAGGIEIVDQRTAHERVLYERALAALGDAPGDAADSAAPTNKKKETQTRAAAMQELLFAVTMPLSESDLAMLRSVEVEVRALGFSFEIGEQKADRLTIKAIPQDLRIGEEEQALRDILDQLSEAPERDPADRRRKIAAAYARRCAVKPGDVLKTEEMRALLRDLDQCGSPALGPNGRRTKIELTLRELEKRFQ